MGDFSSKKSSWLSSVHSRSHVWLFVTPQTAARQASLSITNSWSLFKLMSIESVIPSNHLILCCPILLVPLIFSSIQVFSNESVLCIRWPKSWSFSFSISSSNEYSGLISFRMDRLDLLAVQGTLKSLLQHHSSKASILRCWLISHFSSWLISSQFHWMVLLLHFLWCSATSGLGLQFSKYFFLISLLLVFFALLSRRSTQLNSTSFFIHFLQLHF